MKRAKKTGATKAAKKAAGASDPPDKLYRPFEDLAKKKKEKPKPAPAAAEGDGAPKSAPGKAKASAPKSTPRPRGAAAPPSSKRAARAHHHEDGGMSDAETFAAYMAGVRALDDRATRIPRSANRVERAAKSAQPAVDLDAPARAEFHALVAEGIRFETSDDGERIEGRRVEVEPREVRRLRRGQYTVDQQVDLHGMTAFDARKAMEQFIEKRRKEGDRVVRIIHGKGAHSPRGVSVLRGEIAAWLSQGPVKRHIAAFATAPPEEGGAGALLVLLMRRS